MKKLETLLKDYADHVAERAAQKIPPLPLNAPIIEIRIPKLAFYGMIKNLILNGQIENL